MIKEVKMFKTDDGMLFETEGSAKAHEAEISFVRWYNTQNKLCGNREAIYAEHVVRWLKEHQEKVLDFLQRIG